ncbi:MAG: site-specific integrase [Candidatus Eremiobacter antarcticus]|nr:site-specific integrase [Candidatus Eremiobacteraeota bacterium]MBC5807659.1 site-specific integrase [Candidatus Eremiobacteraeota bacterium]PZR60511.1 MAG: site-specific integrase [Candidatus Eremiobacter sp. RRmetagenome_bin22]
MKGSIFKRKGNSPWTIVYELDRGPNGKRRRAWTTIRGSFRDAQRKQSELVQKRQSGTNVEPNRMTVGKLLDRWLATKTDLAAKTHERYAEIVNVHLKPNLGHYVLEKLRPLDVDDYYARSRATGRRRDGGKLAARTVLQHHRVLREALQQAVRWRLLTANPVDAVTAPRAARSQVNALDEADAAQVIHFFAGTRLELPITLAITTGMRRGELLGLRWQDLDADARTLAVRQSLEHTKVTGLAFKSPKAGKGRRIDLGSIALDALRRHRIAQVKEKLLLGSAYQDGDLICAAPDGKPWHPDAMTAAYRTLIKDSGFPKTRFHDLRHTHATHLLRQGISPKVVAERLGHATVAMTLDTYSHVLPVCKPTPRRRLTACCCRRSRRDVRTD